MKKEKCDIISFDTHGAIMCPDDYSRIFTEQLLEEGRLFEFISVQIYKCSRNGRPIPKSLTEDFNSICDMTDDIKVLNSNVGESIKRIENVEETLQLLLKKFNNTPIINPSNLTCSTTESDTEPIIDKEVATAISTEDYSEVVLDIPTKPVSPGGFKLNKKRKTKFSKRGD